MMHVISAVFNGIPEVFVNCILKIVYGYSGGICSVLWVVDWNLFVCFG